MLTIFSRSSTFTEGTGLEDTVTEKLISNRKKRFATSENLNKHTAEQQNDCVKLKLHLWGAGYDYRCQWVKEGNCSFHHATFTFTYTNR